MFSTSRGSDWGYAAIVVLRLSDLSVLEVARARAELNRSRAVFAARRQTVTEADETFRLLSVVAQHGS